MRSRWLLPLITLLILSLTACDQKNHSADKPVVDINKVTATTAVNALADRYYATTLARFPERAYFSGVELSEHDGMSDNRPTARAKAAVDIDEMLQLLKQIDATVLTNTSEWITHAYLQQTLQSEIAQRSCRAELWNVNQMGGWHSAYPQIAQLQPVGSAALRDQSLQRWSKLAAYADQEIENLKQGLELGYSAPKAVVQRVIDQFDGLLALKIEQSPFYSPASRDDNISFSNATRKLVAEQIYPALQRYRNYLENIYLPHARAALSVTANPDGHACYQALLQSYTTLDRTGQQVYDLGQATVAANKSAVITLGLAAYQLDDFAEIIEQANNDASDKFKDKDELLAFSRDVVRKAAVVMPNWISKMPAQGVKVMPFEDHEEGTGRSAHYRPGSTGRPGEYRIPLNLPEEQSRGNAETVAFHEGWPGHHLQVAIAQEVEGLHPVTSIIWFSGPGEGWVRYAEGLADEMGLYQTTTGPITRRTWPARGMVVDPGIHLFGWSREQAVAYMQASGRFPGNLADQMVDRIAILPGQLTAYDSGGLEILALRKLAEDAMGDNFDIRAFHQQVLENGTIPLIQLRSHIDTWVKDYEATL